MDPRQTFLPADSATVEPAQPRSRRRDEIPDQYKWQLEDIFPDWESWQEGFARSIGGSTSTRA